MKHTPQFPQLGRGSVRADEILSLREFGRRLGLATKCLCDCQRAGLRTVLIGRTKYLLGSDAIAWFAQQAEQQMQQATEGPTQ